MFPGDDSHEYSVRVISIYATKWRHKGIASEHTQPDLELGRLSEFYVFFKDQLPRSLHHDQIDTGRVAFRDPIPGLVLNTSGVWLFALPSDQVVAAITLDFPSPYLTTDASLVAAVLERCTYASITIDDGLFSAFIARLAEGKGATEITTETAPLLPERHQIVFAPRGPQYVLPGKTVIRQILYRHDPPYREEFTGYQNPAELNQSPRLGAITPYVSFLYGHERFVEDSVFLSTVQAVGTASRFRQIWRDAHRDVSEFRIKFQQQETGKQQRWEMERLVDRLGNLEFDLTFSVEFPLMRIESFRSALYQALDLPAQTSALSQMFTQLGGSIRSEITAIDIRERQEEERKQRQNAVAASVLSSIGVPIGFLVAFFGINAKQVQGDRSIFDHHYLMAYGFAALLALVPVAVLLFPHARAWWRGRDDANDPPRRR